MQNEFRGTLYGEGLDHRSDATVEADFNDPFLQHVDFCLLTVRI